MSSVFVDGLPYVWQTGESCIQIQDSSGRGFLVSLTTFTGLNRAEIERARLRKFFHISPEMVANYIRRNPL